MKRWSIVALATLIVAVACATEDTSDHELPGIEDGASEGVSKSLRVDGSEAQHIALKTGASVSIPKGAVDRTLTIGMERPEEKQALTLVKSLKSLDALASAPYVLTPHGTKFKQPVTVELPVSKSAKKLVVGWLEDENDTAWKKLGTPQVSEGKAKIEVDHFSVLVVLEEDGAGFDDPEGPDAGSDVSSPDASAQQPADADIRDAAQAPDADGLPSGKDASTGGASDAGTGLADAGISPPDAGAMFDASYDAGTPLDAWVAPPDAAPLFDTGASEAAVPDDDAGTGQLDTGTSQPDAAEVQEAAAQLPDALPT